MSAFHYYFNRLILHFDRLNHDQWIYMLFVVVLLGLWCMRGFGSRSNY